MPTGSWARGAPRADGAGGLRREIVVMVDPDVDRIVPSVFGVDGLVEEASFWARLRG